MSFSISYPVWFFALCLSAGFLVAWLLYRKKKEAFSPAKIFYALFALRFVSVSLISFLLLSPVLKYLQHKEEKPVIAFLQDNSASQKSAFRVIDSVKYKKDIADLLSDLRNDYTVKEFSYGDVLKDTAKYQFDEQSTDISSALEMVMTTLENENLGAIVLSGDGIYNKGMSPLSLNYPFKGSVFTIGVGDTAIKKDAMIARAFANKMVYLGDQFALRTDMAAYACNGSKLQVSVFSHTANRVIASQQVVVNNNRFSKSIETIVDAKSVGVQHFTISVSKVEGEKNISNNTQEVYVEVIDSKEKILILANAPHPDIFALRDALSKNKNYSVEVNTADRINSKLNDFNLIILHNLPSAKFQVLSVIEQAKKLGIALWYVSGSQTNLTLLNQVQDAIQISSRGNTGSDAQGVLNKEFSYFTINPSVNLSGLPPMVTPFADFKSGPGTQVLFSQKIGSVQTSYPLLLMQQSSHGRVGILAGEGIWRWRLYDFNQHKNHNMVDEFLLKTAQFLSVKHDKKPFRITLAKSVYSDNEAIRFDGELYNDNYELVNTSEVTLLLLDSNKKKFTYNLDKNGNAYSLNIGNLASGKYAYSATTNYNGKSFTASGNFIVVAQNIEEVNSTADFGMMNQLAKNYHGEFAYAKELLRLKQSIRNNAMVKTILRSSLTTEPLINWKWLFAILLALLSVEWFIRKRSGNY